MTVYERFKAHTKASTRRHRKTYKIYNAMEKYGVENFFVETLETNVPIDKLDEREIEYIEKYNSFKSGYNSTPGGDGRIINKINNESELITLAKSGSSADSLAKRFNVNKATIFRTLHKLGFYYHVDPDKVLELAESGKSNKEISDILGCHVYTVSRILRKKNRSKHRLPLEKREIFDYNGLFADYRNQMPIPEICKKYDISETVLNRERKKYGIEARTRTNN